MQSFVKYYEAAHAYVEQSGYGDALVYLDSALRELERYSATYRSIAAAWECVSPVHNKNLTCRCKSNAEHTDPYARGKIQSLLEAVKEEISQVKGYERKLQELNRTVYSSKAPSSNNNQWTPREVVQRQPHREPPPVDNSQWPPREAPQPPVRRQVERPSRPPVKPSVPRQQRQPDVRGAGPKVNSGRGNGKGKPKAQQQDAEPWESWEGQDKELAGNLANDIMDSSPGIRWEDIAGLQDAKRILQACGQHDTIPCWLAPRVSAYATLLYVLAGSDGSSPAETRAVCWHSQAS